MNPHMYARILVFAALLQVALMYLPPLSWGLWKLHFAALEVSLLAALLGGAALALGRGQPWVQGLSCVAMLGGLLPALAAWPVYAREGIAFSPVAWLTGGSTTEVEITRDIQLAQGISADLYRARGEAPHPFVVVVHGGSWRSGDKGEVTHTSNALAAAGYTVIDVRYPLASEAAFPAAIAGVKCAYAQVQLRAAELGIDPSRGALLGRSAGGQIALTAAYAGAGIPSACGTQTDPPRAVIALYAPTDLAWDHANPFVPDVVDGTAALEFYLGGTPQAAPDAYRQGTPMSWLDHPVPPTLLIHGTAERCVRPLNAERLRDALLARGQVVETLLVPFADHGFDVRPGGIGDQLSRAVILKFLAERLQKV